MSDVDSMISDWQQRSPASGEVTITASKGIGEDVIESVVAAFADKMVAGRSSDQIEEARDLAENLREYLHQENSSRAR